MLLSQVGTAIAGTSGAANRKAGYQTENFRIRPSISITQKYDDNVFTTDRDTRRDWITMVAPSLKIDSTWTNHSLRLMAGAESGTYWRYDREDYLDYWAGTEGRYTVSSNTDLFAGLGFNYEHEGRDAPDSPVAQLEPTTYRTFDANAGIKTTHGDTTYRIGGTYEDIDFDNSPGISGRVINDDRDRALIGAGIRAAHILNEKDRVFLQLRYDDRNYDRGADQFGFKRSSDGYRAAAGLMRDWAGGSNFEAYLGVISQDYEDKRFGSITKMDFGDRLTIKLDSGSKIALQLQRSLDETTETGSPGYLNTSFSGRLDHRVSPRLIPYLSLGYSNYDFLKTGRTDRTYSAGAGVKYFVTRNTHVALGTRHRVRDSNDKGLPVGSNEFDETSVFLGFTSRLYPLF
jgi:hypothetical protein